MPKERRSAEQGKSEKKNDGKATANSLAKLDIGVRGGPHLGGNAAPAPLQPDDGVEGEGFLEHILLLGRSRSFQRLQTQKPLLAIRRQIAYSLVLDAAFDVERPNLAEKGAESWPRLLCRGVVSPFDWCHLKRKLWVDFQTRERRTRKDPLGLDAAFDVDRPHLTKKRAELRGVSRLVCRGF